MRNVPMQLKSFSSLILPGICFLTASCASSIQQKNSPKPITVILESRSQSKVTGEIQITELDSKSVHFKGAIKGLNINSEHGFHIHELGDCSSANAASAGGHFNPDKKNHGSFHADHSNSHAGDLGNLKSDAKGEAQVDITLNVTLTGSPVSIAGKSFIVHAKPDDFKTQPSGNSGDRLACGVIPAPLGATNSKPKIDTPPPPLSLPNPKQATPHISPVKQPAPQKTK